eukprot:3940248-Rhodomonas_salina.5
MRELSTTHPSLVQDIAEHAYARSVPAIALITLPRGRVTPLFLKVVSCLGLAFGVSGSRV